jgi:simple sugar transport system permease protein
MSADAGGPRAESAGAGGAAAAPSRAARVRAFALALAAPAIAIALALLAGGAMMLALGQNPFEIYALMARESLGTGYGLGQTLFRATPLLFTGLSVALAFRAGLFNIGAEGQLYLGGFAAAMTGAALAGAPALAAPAARPLAALLVLLAAALAGAVWGAIPGALKARFGAHEVINTIMLNFIAFALVSWLGHFVFQPGTVRTATIAPAAQLPRLEQLAPALRGAPVNATLALGLLTALAVYALLFRTRLGYEMRAVGLNAPAAEYGGIAIGRIQVTAMALAGGVAGLGGANFVLGYKHYFEMGFSGGAGFLGIAVALIGRNHPSGIVIAALMFGALSYGGLVINQRVPKELVEVLQGLVILFAISAQAALSRVARRWR